MLNAFQRWQIAGVRTEHSLQNFSIVLIPRIDARMRSLNGGHFKCPPVFKQNSYGSFSLYFFTCRNSWNHFLRYLFQRTTSYCKIIKYCGSLQYLVIKIVLITHITYIFSCTPMVAVYFAVQKCIFAQQNALATQLEHFAMQNAPTCISLFF